MVVALANGALSACGPRVRCPAAGGSNFRQCQISGFQISVPLFVSDWFRFVPGFRFEASFRFHPADRRRLRR